MLANAVSGLMEDGLIGKPEKSQNTVIQGLINTAALTFQDFTEEGQKQ